MPRTYEKKLLPDGTPNPKWKPRNPNWKKQGNSYKKKLLPDGTPNPKYKPGKTSGSKKLSMFEKGVFIGIDGEGGEYDGKHVYQYLAIGTEHSIYSEPGLNSKACFDFLLSRAREDLNPIYVIFAGSYDMNFWLRDIPKDKIEEMKKSDGKYYVTWEGYQIRFVQRRFFALKKGGLSIQVWDVHGFFQGAFVGAIKQWLPDYDKLDLIVQGKKARVAFTGDDKEFMQAYNQAEIEALQLMMDKLRDACKKMGLTIKAWHGAGAIATAMYKERNIKEYYDELPPEVQSAAKHAYFGGRIEIGKYGRHVGTIHHYDINSAYPAEHTHLPALAGGRWVHHKNGIDPRTSPNRLIVSLVRWDLMNSHFYPFPYRSQMQRKVLFPSEGINWVWRPELEVALDWRDKKFEYWNIEILESWEFIPEYPNFRPFEWVEDHYSERQEIVAESKRTGKPNGVEKAIKLGINSLYGKTAQKIGYDEKTGYKPPFNNMAYAGQITSATRAKLWSAAMQADDCIISLATDGIYSTTPLSLDCPQEKILGKWEYQTHDEMILVQAGFYFIRDGEKWKSFSRGFDKMSQEDDIIKCRDIILEAWKKHKGEVYLPCTRFITLKSALISDTWWERWCTWHAIETDGNPGRRLAITPTGTKRVKCDTKTRADKNMLQTEPQINLFPEDMSMSYEIPWDTDEEDEEFTDTDINLEHDIDSQT